MGEVFYAEGLRFSCQRCSRCCRLEPGYVFLSETDVTVFSRGLRIPRGAFIKNYCREVEINGNRRLSLREKPNLDCVFWEGDGCRAYAYRPLQCRSYPFWHANLASRSVWDALASSCAGIGKGELHSQNEIEGWLRKREDEVLINRYRE
ncbi:MAG: YkgJ family cysteine cluster protein [Spirochaetaceae bacterium]|nr:YkgJ family cysteine cluster protein [Spirochaetaceae bacterium]